MEPREFKTTFFQDFTIADHFWIDAIKDTFERAFKEWKSDYRYLTELVVALNRKMFEHYGKKNYKYTQLYQELFEQADEYAECNLQWDEYKYFIHQTD